MQKVDVISIPVNTGSYSQFVDTITCVSDKKESRYVCVANVHMLVEGYMDREFAEVIRNADIITPDGQPISWAIRLLHGIKQDRVAGMDLLPDILSKASAQQMPVYFYGGSAELLEGAQEKLRYKYPELNIVGMCSPPFRKLTEVEEELIIQDINQSEASLVFVVLGCPKQEKWMASMKGRINAVMIGIGGALPVIAGQQKRAPLWMQSSGLEWLYRLLREPARLFRRYAVTNSLFVYLLLKAYLHKSESV